MENKSFHELSLNILLIGDSSVGKTNILLKYVGVPFYEKSIYTTTGVEFKKKTIIKGKYIITLQIWDTSGQERYRSITQSFLRNADGVIFVYDITNKKTFNKIKEWILDLEFSREEAQFKSIICGNNLELEEKREVKFEDLKKLDYINKLKFLK